MTDQADPAVLPRARRLFGAAGGPWLALAAIRIGPGLMLLTVVAVIAGLSPVFLTTRNVGNVLSQTAVIAVLALAQLLVIITRGIDLSVGSSLALSAVVGALVFASMPSGPLVIVAMLATGTAVGAVNGIAFVYGRLAALAGLALLLTTRLVWGRWIYAVGGNPTGPAEPRFR